MYGGWGGGGGAGCQTVPFSGLGAVLCWDARRDVGFDNLLEEGWYSTWVCGIFGMFECIHWVSTWEW